VCGLGSGLGYEWVGGWVQPQVQRRSSRRTNVGEAFAREINNLPCCCSTHTQGECVVLARLKYLLSPACEMTSKKQPAFLARGSSSAKNHFLSCHPMHTLPLDIAVTLEGGVICQTVRISLSRSRSVGLMRHHECAPIHQGHALHLCYQLMLEDLQ
jgi:hypothetical protein